MRQEQQKLFTSHDGESLFYRYWPAVNQSDSANSQAIILFHRGHEHSGRMSHLVNELNLPDYQFFAWDARGHGQSPGERGDAANFGCLVKDAEYFFRHIKLTYQLNDNDIAVIAQSVGAVIAATWVHDYVPNIRALVLASPAFRVKLYIPFALSGLNLLFNLRGNFFVNSYVKSKLLTHDPKRQIEFDNDPLITRQISTRILLGLYQTSKRIITDARAIQVPTQLLISGSDYVVRRKPQRIFFENLGCAKKECHILPKFYHDTFGEQHRDLAIDKSRKFIIARFKQPVQLPSLLDADLHGFTKVEADNLALPPKNIVSRCYWRLVKAVLSYGGRLSKGIRLGIDTGFDSGSTLDYVYKNQPAGESSFGRFIDYLYLQSIGWQGIRQRKENIQTLLQHVIEQQYQQQQPIHLVDIAAGHGRYVLETINESNIKPDSVLLRDYSDINIRDGQALIQQLGLSSLVRFQKGDAFNETEISKLEPKPSIAIVSGLYELFSDNQLIKASLSGLAQAVPVGGYLIYTGQPWHPQLEFIARALTSHRQGQAWVMRRRTQLEMDQLVCAAGFRKVEMKIDQWGIFSVSLAQRIK